MNYEPHPYALLLPSLTDDEYKALKADIKAHGILYPIIIDEDDRVLDGVHRERIASELRIDPPVSRHAGLDNDRKLHLAVGLNMRRRHLDADRRRELVRRLHDQESMSVRAIASVTGWSKSTVDRDLKTSPFEHILNLTTAAHASMVAELQRVDRDDDRSFVGGIVDLLDMNVDITRYVDGQWKRGSWPPADPTELVQAVVLALTRYSTARMVQHAVAKVQGIDDTEPLDWRPLWDNLSPEQQQRKAVVLRDHGFLDCCMGALPRVDAGIDHGDDCPWCRPVSQMGQQAVAN